MDSVISIINETAFIIPKTKIKIQNLCQRILKNLLSYLNDFKLPINYNVTITEELINENNKKDNKSFIYKYIKK